MADDKPRECTQPLSPGVALIAEERVRQVSEEGWDANHDDEHSDEDLAWAAVCYAAPVQVFTKLDHAEGVEFVDPWPWERGDDKRPRKANGYLKEARGKERIRQLVKAGALIAAEIDRLRRAGGAQS